MGTRALVALALLLGVLGANLGIAAEWYLVPAINMRSEFNSNLNYDFVAPKSDFIFTLSPEASFNYTTENAMLQGRLGLKGLHYISHSSIDHIDQNYQVNGRYQPTARLNFTLQSAYVNDTSLREELIASGLILSRTPRQSIMFGPGVTYAMTEYLLATFKYNFNKVNYSDPQFQNYASHNVGLTLEYLLKNQRTSLLGSIIGRETDYTIGNTYRALGFFLGANHRFSENWDANFLGGINYSVSRFNTQVLDLSNFPYFVLVRQVGLKETNVSPYVQLSTTRRWARTSLTAGYSRDQNASGAGTIVDVSRLFFSLKHSFTEKLDGGVGGYYSLSSAISQKNSFENDFFNVTPSLSYRVTEKFSVSSGYRFGLRDDITGGRTGKVHVVWLMLNYSKKIGLGEISLMPEPVAPPAPWE